MPKFSSLFDFQKRFPNDEACLEYLEQLRWPAGFRCPNCQHDDGYRLVHRRLIQCAVCRHQTSATAGTIFHKTRTPLLIWFWIVYLIGQDKGGISMLKLSRDLGMHYDTVWNLVHKVRTAMASRDQQITLAGFIELDEAILGPEARKVAGPKAEGQVRPRKKRLGRRSYSATAQGKTQCEAIVMVERENMLAGNLVVKVVNSTTRDEIRDLVTQRVEPDQWFKTDGAQVHILGGHVGGRSLIFGLVLGRKDRKRVRERFSWPRAGPLNGSARSSRHPQAAAFAQAVFLKSAW